MYDTMIPDMVRKDGRQATSVGGTVTTKGGSEASGGGSETAWEVMAGGYLASVSLEDIAMMPMVEKYLQVMSEMHRSSRIKED